MNGAGGSVQHANRDAGWNKLVEKRA